MGKAFIWLVLVTIVLFIGYLTVVSRVEVPWYQIALWWGYIVSGSLAIITGLVYVALLVKNRIVKILRATNKTH